MGVVWVHWLLLALLALVWLLYGEGRGVGDALKLLPNNKLSSVPGRQLHTTDLDPGMIMKNPIWMRSIPRTAGGTDTLGVTDLWALRQALGRWRQSRACSTGRNARRKRATLAVTRIRPEEQLLSLRQI